MRMRQPLFKRKRKNLFPLKMRSYLKWRHPNRRAKNLRFSPNVKRVK
jgi:hypothetical protein